MPAIPGMKFRYRRVNVVIDGRRSDAKLTADFFRTHALTGAYETSILPVAEISDRTHIFHAGC